jgi:hypothetical protein
MQARCAAPLLVALLGLRSAPVYAADPVPRRAAPRPRGIGVRLDYERGPGARQCPDEKVLRGEVAAEIGDDPFTEAGPWSLRAVVTRKKNGAYVATADLFDGDGAPGSSMGEMVSYNCRSLVVKIVAVWASVVLTDPPPEPEPASPPPPPPAPTVVALPPPDAPLPQRPTMDPFLVLIGLGSTVGFGIAPRPAAGVTADVGFHWKVDAAPLEGVSLTLGVRWDPPASSPPLGGFFRGVRIVTTRVLGTVAPCGHWWKLYGCAIGELGQLRHHYEDRIAYPVGGIHDLHAAIGGRIGIEVPFAPHIGFRGFAEVLGTITPVVAYFNNRPVWSTASSTESFGAGLYVFF